MWEGNVTGKPEDGEWATLLKNLKPWGALAH